MRLLLSIILLCSLHLAADEYHYKNLLVGTKAIGLGGAFTGISDDLSAIFYNPAGLTQTTSSNSASISTFAWEETSIKRIFSGGDSFTRSSFSVVPSFLGLGGNNNNLHWSLGFGVSDLSVERNYVNVYYPLLDDNQQVIGEQIEFANIDLENSSLDLGGGIALKLSDSISVGGSLIAKYKKFETAQGSGVNQVFTVNDGSIYSGFTASRRIIDESILLTPSVGLLYHSDDFNMGLKLAKDYTVNRSFKAHHNIFVASAVPLPPSAKPAVVGTIRGDEQQEFSSNISLGFAKTFSDIELSFDIDYFSSVEVDDHVVDVLHPPITRDLAQVINYSLGMTFYQEQDAYFRFGIFTDNSNGKIDVTQPYQRMEVIDMLGLSIDYTTSYFGLPISFGSYVKHGEGHIRLADIRVVENIVGLPLYPPRVEYDISDATKSLFVLFISANF